MYKDELKSVRESYKNLHKELSKNNRANFDERLKHFRNTIKCKEDEESV